MQETNQIKLELFCLSEEVSWRHVHAQVIHSKPMTAQEQGKVVFANIMDVTGNYT